MEIFNKDVSVLGELTLSLVNAPGSIITIDGAGIVRFRTPAELASDGVDLNYVHDQGVASATWSVSHNLGKLPSVTVVDTAGSVVVGDVSYTDNNNLIVTFNNSFSGEAYIN